MIGRMFGKIVQAAYATGQSVSTLNIYNYVPKQRWSCAEYERNPLHFAPAPIPVTLRQPVKTPTRSTPTYGPQGPCRCTSVEIAPLW